MPINLENEETVMFGLDSRLGLVYLGRPALKLNSEEAIAMVAKDARLKRFFIFEV